MYALFFFSGVAGLVYEVVWSRLLKDVFGVTAHAVAAVLAAYLGGLALGSWLLGRAVDRRRHPLRLYGLFELGIGFSALLTAFLLPLLEPLHARAALRFAPGSAALAVVRLLLASAIVLPPTILMGGTLPAMTRAFVDRLAAVGQKLSFLYALNTAGAVLGSLLAGFALIRAFGVHPTLFIAVAANLLVGSAALALARGKSAPAAPADDSPAGRITWVLFAVGLSGVASLALEVIWTRILILILGTSTYAFATMLTAFLVGIALGSGLLRLFDSRLRDPRRLFGWVQIGIAASMLAGIPLLDALVSSGQQWLQSLELRWLALSAARFGIAFLVMLVPVTLIGMSFPLAGKIGVRGVATLGRELGQVYAANSLGNIAGAVLGGFVLIPLVGMQRGIALLAILNLAAAAWAILPGSRSRVRALPLAALFLACAALLAWWRPRPFHSVEETEGDRILFYREGLESTVTVFQRAVDARQRVMLVDGVRIGQSSVGIDNKQQVLAHLPFLLRPSAPPRHVLSIGLGTGILMGEAARHGLEGSICLELSPEVVEGARFFAGDNDRVLENPQVRVVVDDGINFLARERGRWDAIVSDGKSRHGHVGNARFFSADYYRSARAHLAPGGLMLQWVPLDEAPGELRTIARTFVREFPHAYLWVVQESLFLLGQEAPLSVDLPPAQRVLDAPETAGLRRHGWRSASELSTLLLLDSEAMRPWLLGEETINSVERPVLEFFSPSEVATPAESRIAENLAALSAARRGPLREARFEGADPSALQADAEARDDLLAGIASGNLALIESVATRSQGVLKRWAASRLLRAALERDAAGQREPALALYRKAVLAWPEDVMAQVDLAEVLAQSGATLEAMQHAFTAVRLNPDSGSAHHVYGRLLAAVGNHEQAVLQLREAARVAPDAADVHNDLGQSLALLGRADDALAQFREAMRLSELWPVPMSGAALLLATHQKPGEALPLARRAVELTKKKDAGALQILALSSAEAGMLDEAVAAQKAVVELASAAGDRRRLLEAQAALERYQKKSVSALSRER